MQKRTITFHVELDDKNTPERIVWDATDKPETSPDETPAISLSLWDRRQHHTLRIDLWTKQMPVNEMKRFYVDCLGGLAQTILSATGDSFMSEQTQELCNRLVEHIRKEGQ